MNKKIMALLVFIILIGIGSLVMPFKDHDHSLVEDEASLLTAPIAIKDGTNHWVRLQAPAQRIVALTASDSELLHTLGVAPRGVVSSSDLPEDVQKALKKYPNMGSAVGPSVERILLSNSDLVLGVAMPFQTTLRKPLAQNGIPSYYHLAHDYDEILKQIHDIGLLAGKEKEANALIASYNKHLKALQEKNKDLPKKRILIVFGTPVSYQLATSYTYVGDIFNKLGAINVADQYLTGPYAISSKDEKAHDKKKAISEENVEGYIPLNLETMSLLNPDMVLIVMHGSDKGAEEAFKKAFRSPAWRNIPAIRDGRIYVVPGKIFSFVPAARMNQVLDYGEEILYGKGH